MVDPPSTGRDRIRPVGARAVGTGDSMRSVRRWLEALLRTGGGAARLRAKALTGLGDLAWGQSDFAAARALHEEALALWHELGDEAGAARALASLGHLAYDQADLAPARALHEEALALWQTFGNPWGINRAVTELLDEKLSAQEAAKQGADKVNALFDQFGIKR